MRRSWVISALAAVGLVAGLMGSVGAPSASAAPADPDSGTFRLAGSFNSEMGCPGDWNNDCDAAALTFDEDSGLFVGQFEDVAAGEYEFKVSRNASWDDEDVWGRYGQQPGDNIPVSTDGKTLYAFFDPTTGEAFAGNRADLYTVRGTFQSQVGCAGDWDDSDCLATVMFPQPDGTYRYQTSQIGEGAQRFKVALGTGWDTAWPDADVDFTTNPGELVVFNFDPADGAVEVEVTNPPVPGTGQQRAIWLDTTTIAWPTSLGAGADGYTLVGQSDVTLVPGTLTTEQTDLDWRTRTGYIALELQDAETGEPLDTSAVAELLQGPIQIQARDGDTPVAQTGAQIASVLDVLYAGAAQTSLGVVWEGATPTLRLWAPTAQDVALLLWTDGEMDEYGNFSGDPQTLPATRDDNGVWSVAGEPDWRDGQYLWQVTVFVPDLGDVVTNEVTDPYSVGLTINSTRSVVLDLDDARWAPAGWGETTPEPLRTESEQTIYELHVRDFSAWDETVPEELRGSYAAFTLPDSDGVNHLRALSEAGVTTLHLLPTFDIATTTIPELRADQVVPDVPDAAPDSPDQQAAVSAVADQDAFNWGYDPFHWSTPEGSYASAGNQVGGDRTREYREMVTALHDLDLRVVQDVVFNHTAAAGQAATSVLDRIVPGYYHRLNANGVVETSTCCSNVATEHTMAEKMMVDSIVTNATGYGIDGFRFDLMGHHSLENMIAVREALDALTLAEDGVDGSQIYLYGEGWDFGEVANNALFIQATQGNIAGTDIGTFNDRLRDAVRGGGPFDEDQREWQGFGTGAYTLPNAVANDNDSPEDQLANLLHETDLVRIGLAGSLKDFSFLTTAGTVQTGAELDYNGQPAGYTASPQEAVNYVEAHDNETLFDNGVWKLPTDVDMDTRVRSQLLSNATVLLGQSPAFLASGTELLRSKSLDRDSYNSGDWFNAIDWTGTRSTFGTGLPVADKNADKWSLMAPLLADADIKPDPAAMAFTSDVTLDLLRLRASSPLFTLGDAELVKELLTFPNSGPEATPGLLVMAIDDSPGAAAATEATEAAAESTAEVAADAVADSGVDPDLDGIVVVFNASPETITEEIEGMAGRELELSPIQQEGADPVVKEATWDAASGAASVPGWSVAVFVEPAAVEPPVLPGTITLDPSEVEAGASTEVTGAGWLPGSEVTLALQDTDVTLTVTVGDDGGFLATLPVPAETAAGTYTVAATDELGGVATAPLTVTAPGVEPPAFAGTVTLDPDSVTAGGKVTVSGEGWTPGAELTLTLEPGALALGTVTVGPDGTFSTTVVVPDGTTAGDYEVAVSDGTHTVSAALTVTATSTGGGSMPGTGADIAWPLLAAVGLLGLGIALRIIRRRTTA